MAQRRANALAAEIPLIDLILGPDTYRAITDHVQRILQGGARIIDVSSSEEVYEGICPQRNTITDFVSIMRGCDNYCSYCIVPYVRGHARSRPVADIMQEIDHCVHQGVKEITLLGQNVNEYNHQETDFAALLRSVAQRFNEIWFRFLTSHPKDLDGRTIDTIAKEPALCEWFHIPMQSGNDRILALMDRRYTRTQYAQLVRRIRTRVPHATITTDIIVGFPTEQEQEYRDTLNAMEEFQFDDAYMYRYSPRDGTKAARLPVLEEEVVLERLRQCIALQHAMTYRKRHGMINKTFDVLIEEPAKVNGMRGKTRGNIDVIVEDKVSPGTFQNVRVEGIVGNTLVGHVST